MSKHSVSFEAMYARLASGPKKQTAKQRIVDLLTTDPRGELLLREIIEATGLPNGTVESALWDARQAGLITARGRRPLRYSVKEPLAGLRNTARPPGAQPLRKTQRKTGGQK